MDALKHNFFSNLVSHQRSWLGEQQMWNQVKAASFTKETASPGIPPQEFCIAPGIKTQVVAAQSLPICATALRKSDLSEAEQWNNLHWKRSLRQLSPTIKIFSMYQGLLWESAGDHLASERQFLYCPNLQRASSAHLVTAGSPTHGQRASAPFMHCGSAHLLWAA